VSVTFVVVLAVLVFGAKLGEEVVAEAIRGEVVGGY
jgi:hypothetical protein